MNKYIPTLVLLLLASILSAQVNIRENLRFENKIRGFWVHTPPGYDGTQRLPLVINMHGFTMNGNQQLQYTQMNTRADAENFIVAYPDGIDGRWATGAFFGIEHPYDDVGFINTIVDMMTWKYNIDPVRTYATGYSAGGFMSLGLACSSSSRFAAVAPVAANMNFSIFNTCEPPRKLPVAFFNGLADNIVPVAGIPGQFPSLTDIIKFWSNNDLCDPVIVEDTLPNINTTDNSRATLTIYPPCAGSEEVRFYKLLNGGHTWPGAAPGPLGNTNQDISANAEMWNFFQNYQIPALLTISRPAPFTFTKIDDSNYDISFDAVPGAAYYEVQVWDSTAKTITRFFGFSSPISINVTDTTALVALGAASPSGYRDWTPFRKLNSAVPTNTVSFLSQGTSQTLFPNPSQDRVFLDLNRFSGTVSIYNLTGTRLFTEQWDNVSGIKSVQIGDLSTGTYLLTLENNEGRQVFRVVRQ
jgi:polyhydroxybutyrate depolymerase